MQWYLAPPQEEHYAGDNTMIILGANNNFNGCLKILSGGEIHQPCNPFNYHLDPRFRHQRCNQFDRDFNRFTHTQHQQSCAVLVVPIDRR